MGNEVSVEAQAAADARFEAELKAMYDEQYPKDLKRYQDMKAAKDKRVAEEKAAGAAKVAAAAAAHDEVQATTLSAAPSILVRSSKGDATLPVRPSKPAALFTEDSDDESTDLLNQFNPRKKPARKATGSANAEDVDDFVGFGNEISTQEASTETAKPLKPSGQRSAKVDVGQKAKRNNTGIAAKPGSSGAARSSTSKETSTVGTNAKPAKSASNNLSITKLDSRKAAPSDTTKKPATSANDTSAKAAKKPSSLPAASASASLSTSSKRPASNAFADERGAVTQKTSKTSSAASPQSIISGASLPKIPKRKTVGSAKPFNDERPTSEMEITSIDERPPRWYLALSKSSTRGKDEANADTILRGLKEDIKAGKSHANGRDGTRWRDLCDSIREKLHKVAFQPVSGQLLRNNRTLHNEDGLPCLFDTEYAKGVDWPFDISADAKELYHKWCRGVFETDLLRGIIPGKPSSNKPGTEEEDDGSAAKLDPDYKERVRANFHGNGLLLNGQWWPTQLCAVRDGAHTHTIQGISGNVGDGAYSCIMSGGKDPSGKPYPDEDHGDEVLYCGTDGKNGKISDATQRMLESEGNHPIRLIRSSKVHSKWAPEIGLRYDGLYEVVGYELLDRDKQRHRFKLVRVVGQDPIRGRGPEKRPTREEKIAYAKDRENRGFT